MVQKTLIAICLMCAVQPALGAGRGYLGVWFADIPATETMKQTGVVVNKVFAGSAAQRAGLKPGDVVTRINGVAVRDPKATVALVAENTAGERISLTVIERTGGGIRQSNVFATLATDPTSAFAKIMIAKPMPHPRHTSHSSTASPCIGAVRTRDRPCRADVAAEH